MNTNHNENMEILKQEYMDKKMSENQVNAMKTAIEMIKNQAQEDKRLQEKKSKAPLD